MHTGAYSDFKNNLLDQASELRARIRSGDHTAPTSGQANSLLQGNVVILPSEWAGDFLLYCQNNPVACPLIGMSQPGDPAFPTWGTIWISGPMYLNTRYSGMASGRRKSRISKASGRTTW